MTDRRERAPGRPAGVEREGEGRARKEENNKESGRTTWETAFRATPGSVAEKVRSHTLLQADRENPADRWGDGGTQANQTEEREGGQSEGG